MKDMEYLKTVNRTIAIGNRRVVITFDENNVPIIHSGILPGDYLCWSHKRGWYCSASADNPGNIVGIFINEKGNYLPVKALTEAPCSSKDVKLYKMPSLRDLKEIENVRDILDNSLAAAGFAKLPGDLLSAFWSCDDRFYNRIKRPLIIDSYNKLCEKYQIKNEPFLKLQGMVVTTFAEEGKPELDLRKNHKLLLVSTGAKDVSNQIFWVLYEFSPNVFYVLNDKLVASDPLKTEDYKKLLSMPEVRKRIYFPEADMKNLMFVYEDGTLSEQVEQKMILGIPFTFRDGARAIVRPYPFVCYSFDEFRQLCSKLVCFPNKKWSFPKREHLVELAHCDSFRKMQRNVGIDEEWREEWAYSSNPQGGNIANAWMVPIVRPACCSVDWAYKNLSLPASVHTTLNDFIHVLFVMYL